MKKNDINKKDIIAYILIALFVLLFINNKMSELNYIRFKQDCNNFEESLVKQKIVDYSYSININTYEDYEIRIFFDIYDYDESMQKDFEYIFKTVYKQYQLYPFENGKVALKEITIFDWKTNEDGNGGSGIGIARKIFD